MWTLPCTIDGCRVIRHLVFSTFFLSFVGTAAHGDDRKVALEVAEKNRESCELIQSYSCSYVKTISDNNDKITQQNPRCDYWRRGDRFRLLWKDGDKWCDTVIDGDTVRSKSNVNKGGKKAGETAVVAKYPGLPQDKGDPWFDGLLVFPDYTKQSQRPLTLAQLLNNCGDKYSVSCVPPSDERTFWVITLTIVESGDTSEFWLDAKKNYLITKQVSIAHRNNGKSTATTSIEAFAQPVRGIYVPEKIVRVYSTNDTVDIKESSVCYNIRINSIVDKSIFDLDFAPNSVVVDTIRGVRYNTGNGSQELQVTPARPLDGTFAGRVNPAPQAPTTSEANPASPYVIAAYVFGALLVAFLLVAIHKLRKK